MDRGIDEGDRGVEHEYGRERDTELYEMMLAELLAARAPARGERHRHAPPVRGVVPAGLAPMHLWLICEGLARGDPRIDWRAECALLARNRWVPVLYEADGIPGLAGRSPDTAYDEDRVAEDSPAGCRNRLIALLAVLDGPEVTVNYDVEALTGDIVEATGGNDPLAVGADVLLSMAEQRRYPGR